MSERGDAGGGSKRSAFEPAAQLLRPVGYDPGMRRPLATVTGGVLVLLRVLAGVLWMINVALQGPGWLQDVDAASPGIDLAPDVVATSIAIVLVAAGVVLAVEAVLGVLILRGKNFPRVVVMAFAVLSISTSFVGWIIGGQNIRITTTLLTVALDILILLALSSRSAAAYARRNERR